MTHGLDYPMAKIRSRPHSATCLKKSGKRPGTPRHQPFSCNPDFKNGAITQQTAGIEKTTNVVREIIVIFQDNILSGQFNRMEIFLRKIHGPCMRLLPKMGIYSGSFSLVLEFVEKRMPRRKVVVLPIKTKYGHEMAGHHSGMKHPKFHSAGLRLK